VGASKPDFEIKYAIRNNRTWEIRSARDEQTYGPDDEACMEYDYILAKTMLSEKMWQKKEVTLRFEIKDDSMLSEGDVESPS
jgi:hypothetical protein